nr:Gfo/Idh/MocA family oxidoreductase [bacterium]
MNDHSRRKFLKTATIAAASTTLPRFTIGKPGKSANSKLNIAVVGVGGMGGYATRSAANENQVALCDVDDARCGWAYKEFPKAPRFKDFRVMLDKMGDDIDAVAISTPDHTHFAAAMAAIERGKHVFVQKPLAHNIWQCRTLRMAAKHYKVVTQMGNQGHTFDGMRRIKEWVDGGVVGEVKEVVTWTNRPLGPWFVPPSQFPPKSGPAPGTLDWKLWQGPAKHRDYSADYVPTRWRGWWDYGCGALGDIGCHTFDAPFWALGLGSPTKVEVERKEPPHPDFIPMSSVTTYHFPARGNKPPVKLKWYEKGYDVPLPKRWDEGKKLDAEGGMYMEGSENTLYHPGMRPRSPRITPNDTFMELRPKLAKMDRIPSVKGGPIEEWVRAIKGEGPTPGSQFDYAAPLTEMVLLGALAQRTGKTIEWDNAKMLVKGQPELNELIKEPTPDEWQYGEKLWK